MTSRRFALACALAACGVAPAGALAAQVTPIKSCYVSIYQDARQTLTERMFFSGTGFTPNAKVDIKVDGRVVRTETADAAGTIRPPGIPVPYVAKGVRGVLLTVAEQGNPANVVEKRALVNALSLRLLPSRAAPSARVHWRGRGFTGKGPVYAHYLFRGRKHRKTVRLGRAKGECGRLSVRRRQFPFKPRSGRWIVQVDHQKRYSRRPSGPFVQFRITVRRIVRFVRG